MHGETGAALALTRTANNLGPTRGARASVVDDTGAGGLGGGVVTGGKLDSLRRHLQCDLRSHRGRGGGNGGAGNAGRTRGSRQARRVVTASNSGLHDCHEQSQRNKTRLLRTEPLQASSPLLS